MAFNLPQLFGGSQPSQGGSSDPMMDMAMMANGGDPDRARQMYMSFVGGRAGAANSDSQNPMLQPLSGSNLPQTNELSKLFPGHPRLGGALDNAAMAMSMIPTGNTIGENIQGVSNALTELPYARLAHQFQMMQPGLQTQQTQASIYEQLMRGQMYSGKNQAQVEAARQRDMAETQVRMALGNREVTTQAATEDDPLGRWKKGEPVVGNLVNTGVSYDDKGNPTAKREFQSVMPYDHYVQSGGVNMSGGVTGGSNNRAKSEFQQHIDSYADLYPNGKNGKLAAGSPQLFNEAEADYNQTKQNAAVSTKSAEGALPPTTAEKFQQQQTADKDAYKTVTDALIPKKMSDYGTEYIKRGGSKGTGQTLTQFVASYSQQTAQTKSQIDSLRDSYTRLPQDQQTGFSKYLRDNGFDPTTRTFTKSTPTSSEAKSYDPATGTIK